MIRRLAFLSSLLLFFTIPWEGSLVISGLGSVARVAGLLAIFWWLVSVIELRQVRTLRPFHGFVVLFVGWNAISILWSYDPNRTYARVETYVQLALMIWLLWDLYGQPSAIQAGFQAYLLGASISIASLIYNFLQADYSSYRRFSAFNFDPNDLGVRLVIGIVMAWYLLIVVNRQRSQKWLNLYHALYIPAATFAVFLTASRTAFTTLAIAVLYILTSCSTLRWRARLLLYASLIVAVIVIVSLVPASSWERLSEGEDALRTGSLQGRGEIWREGLTVFAENPFIGVGSGAFQSVTDLGRSPHNLLISLLAETGIIGLILFSLILLVVGACIWSMPKSEARLWLTLVLVWGIGASTLNWETRKLTWIVLGMAITATAFKSSNEALSARQPTAEQLTSSRLRLSPPVEIHT